MAAAAAAATLLAVAVAPKSLSAEPRWPYPRKSSHRVSPRLLARREPPLKSLADHPSSSLRARAPRPGREWLACPAQLERVVVAADGAPYLAAGEPCLLRVRHGAARRGTSRHVAARRGTARHGTARHGVGRSPFRASGGMSRILDLTGALRPLRCCTCKGRRLRHTARSERQLGLGRDG